MLYNRPPGAPGPLANQPPSYATSAVGRQAVSSIGGAPSVISPVGFPQGSPLQQPGSGYSGMPQIGSNPMQGAPNPAAGQSPSMGNWNNSRNQSTLLRALIGNHTTPGQQ